MEIELNQSIEPIQATFHYLVQTQISCAHFLLQLLVLPQIHPFPFAFVVLVRPLLVLLQVAY